MLAWFPGPVLGIETSCDETSAALVESGRVVSNVVSSQAALHARWGGVVPEAASRAHVEAILPVLQEALGGVRPAAVAVTDRPGLVGALAVGVSAAHGLVEAWGVPLVGVHHVEAHILSVLADGATPEFPHLCLVVSGGHTELVEVRGPGEYRTIAATLDDAAGEAFDKGGRALGFDYPAGRAVEEAAREGAKGRYKLPPGMPRDRHAFSFSGLKTAAARLVDHEGPGLHVPSAALALEEAIVASLVAKLDAWLAVSDARTVTLVGGVAANQRLRREAEAAARRWGRAFVAARADLCTDNAAMVALAGSLRLAQGERHAVLEPQAQSPLPGLARPPR
jgi:N6-L-threonylcarbamoyladenine synthase